jgi:hypothetical protein
MSTRREVEVGIQPVGDEPSTPATTHHRLGGEGPAISHWRQGPRSLDEAEAAYVAARDAWTAAMRQAASGRPADLASLAIAQDIYEAANAEVARWRSGERVAIAVDDRPQSLDTIVGQEFAWRRVHEDEARERPGLLGRIARRLSGR